jgi:hypothetical protein
MKMLFALVFCILLFVHLVLPTLRILILVLHVLNEIF